jgi:hypothetical protein
MSEGVQHFEVTRYLSNQTTGEDIEVKITVEGAPDGYALLEAVRGLTAELESAERAARMIAGLAAQGVLPPEIMSELGLVKPGEPVLDEETAAQRAQLMGASSIGDDAEAFLRGLQ